MDEVYQSNSPGLFQVAGPPVGQSVYVRLVVTNNCGCQLNRQAPGKSSTAYPNPADGQLSVEQGGGPAVLRNAYGQSVWHQKATPGLLRLDTSHLPAGLYYLEARDGRGRPVRQQVRIQH